MLLIKCPYCGDRPELEFRHAGEAHLVRDPAGMDDEAWAGFLYKRENVRGLHRERWRHIHGCGRFFNAIRDTTNDMFQATYKPGEKPPGEGAP